MEKKLTFDEISLIDDDLLRNEALYEYFDEDNRLKSRVGNVEFITTMKKIEELLKPGMRILDMGAGTGVYSIPLASKGFEVVSYEPSKQNYQILEKKVSDLSLNNISLKCASSFDMHELPSDYFDIVLLFGPLYHLSKYEDQMQTLDEAKRVCKDDGYILVSIINHDMIPMTETGYNVDWFEFGAYDKETLKVTNRPFIFFSLDESRELLEGRNLKIENTIATDGFAELLGQKLEEMSEFSYKQYLRWHLSRCEKKELLGASNHLLFVCTK